MEIAIDVRNLTKVYEGKTVALDGVNLKVESGKIFALLGPNGAGKTTLMRILTTQLKPTSGEARIFGLDAVRDEAEVRRLIGYIPQEMSVWTDITGYENLLIYAKIYGIPPTERKEIISKVLHDMGLSEVGGDLVKTYSGGMIRRLEIACAMLIGPRLLLLDEPTIGLDPSARKIVWERIQSFKSNYGSTIFFTTHYMDEADLYSDEIIIINRGRVAKTGIAVDLKHLIGEETVILTIEGDSIDDVLLDETRRLDGVKDVMAKNADIRAIVRDAETALPRLMETLIKGGLSVEKISVTKPSLDDVFVKYAGDRIEAGGAITEVRQVRARIKR